MSLHIGAKKKTEIADTVLLPGDPKRSEFIAKEYLTAVKQYTDIRLMKGFTGKYKGVPVSIQTTGMGMPSMGIVSYELIKEYGVKNLIRTGTCGSFKKEVKIGDLLFAQSASTDSNFVHSFKLNGNYAPTADYSLLEKAVSIAKAKKAPYHVGNVLTTDVFYEHYFDDWKKWAEGNVLGVEMEVAALYLNSAFYKAKAVAVMSVSDSFTSNEKVSPKQRETIFTNMIEIALETAIKA